jgi:FkbH-like protein
LLVLRRRGVLLAVVSKNNPAQAREPFERHPDMRLALSDFVAFRAGWDDKSALIRQLAEDLSLGLDAFVFIDDNPFERAAVRETLPEVDVLELPVEPSGYPAALAGLATLEPGRLTAEDTGRTEQYQALARTADARATAGTGPEFLAGLQMRAEFAPVDETTLPRVVQLIGKTNQFNLTGRRHGSAAVQDLIGRAGGVHLTLRLRDRFVDHGLVGVVLAVPTTPITPAAPSGPGGSDLMVDTWLMSCRVLGRGVEIATMTAVTEAARALGYSRVIGEYLATDRNEPAREAYQRSGFTVQTTDEERTTWVFDLADDVVPDPGHVSIADLIRLTPEPVLADG